MEICFYRAECGDAASLRYVDNDGKIYNVLIDSGYERTYRDILSSKVEDIQTCNEQIDLWVISHIHSDHIGGVINYIAAINKGLQPDLVAQWLYNPPRPDARRLLTKQTSTAASIGQGDNLTKYLNGINKYPDREYTSEMPAVTVGSLTLTLLSPGRLQLENLHTKYKLPDTPLEKIENEIVSEAKGVKKRDHHIKVDDFDLLKWKQDDNVDNGSSISFISQYKGSNILWLADAHPNVVAQSLKDLGYSITNPLSCTHVKVAHHGSSGNNSDELYSLIKCHSYIFSVNGDNKDRLPNKESLVRILKRPNRDIRVKYTFYFTYDDSILRSIFSVDTDSVFEKLNFEVQYGSGNFLAFSI